MKLTKEGFERTDTASTMELFLQGIKAEQTREKYTHSLRYILCGVLDEILDGTFEQRVEQFVKYGKENPDWIRDLLLGISKKMRQCVPNYHRMIQTITILLLFPTISNR